MAESTAHALRGYSGAAVATELASGITSGATSIDCVDLSTWTAVDDVGPFRFTITDGTTEEECEGTSVSGNTINTVTRGVGETTAAAWSSGATVKHTESVRDLVEANRVVNRILGVASVAAGDLYYVSSVSTGPIFSRLAKGTAKKILRMNAAATAPEWGGFDPIVTRKSANESVTSSTTLQNDDELKQAIGASEVWKFEFDIGFTGQQADDLKVAVTVPSGATVLVLFDGPASAVTTTSGDQANVGTTTSGDSATFGCIGTSTIAYGRIVGTVSNSTNTGDIQLQFAQASSSGTAVTVVAGSVGTFRRIS